MPKWIYPKGLHENHPTYPIDIEKAVYFYKVENTDRHVIKFVFPHDSVCYNFETREDRNNFFDNLLNYLDSVSISTKKDPLQ